MEVWQAADRRLDCESSRKGLKAMRNYRDKYLRKMLENPLPKLTDNERIYLNMTYADRQLARSFHCGFDRERKLWFTGAYNAYLGVLVELFGVDEEHTSDDAMQLMHMALDTPDRNELLKKILDWHEKHKDKVEKAAKGIE